MVLHRVPDVPRDELTTQLGTKNLGSGKVGNIHSGALSAQKTCL